MESWCLLYSLSLSHHTKTSCLLNKYAKFVRLELVAPFINPLAALIWDFTHHKGLYNCSKFLHSFMEKSLTWNPLALGIGRRVGRTNLNEFSLIFGIFLPEL